MDRPFPAYQGEEPYIFVCYAHEDSDAVYPEIAWLHDQGVNVWYDEGISPGLEWSEALASAIQRSTKVLFFVTPHSVASEHCRRELNFAQEEAHDVVAVHLTRTEIPPGLRLSLNNRQAILRHELSDDLYRHELMQVAQTAVADPAKPVPQPITVKPSSNRTGLAMAVVAAAAVIALSVWWLNSANKDPAPTLVAESVEPNKQEVLHNAIAVLPFDNLSPDPNNAYFAAGIHEEILNQLAKIKELSVIARTTMNRYAKSDKSVPEIAAELNVATVMEGSVRFAGERVRITAQLIDAETGAHLWSESYDRNLEDIFAIQSDIAFSVTDAMKVQFSLSEQQAVAKRPTENIDAYARYVEALTLRRNLDSPDPVHALLDQAIALDSGFADAMATKAWLYGFQVEAAFEGANPTRDSQLQYVELAREYAERALALDPDQAEAHLALSSVYQYFRRWDSAFTEARRAYELNPNHYAIAFFYGRALMRNGKVDAGISLIERAIDLDPRNWSIHFFFGMELGWRQRWERAKEHTRIAIVMAPDFGLAYWQLAYLAAYSGDDALALTMVQKAEELTGNWPGNIVYSEVYALLDRDRDVERLFTAAEEVRSQIRDDLWFQAYAAVGETDAAIQHLETVVDKNFPNFAIYNLHDNPDHPRFDGVRQHPKFGELISDIGDPL